MVLAPFRQTNFAGGRLGPELFGRTDHAKYQAGLAEVRNCTVQRHSGVENRAGLRYCGGTKAPSFQGIPWVTAAGQSFSLEQGAGYIRLWQNGAPLLANAAPLWLPSVYVPAGQVVRYGGSYYYCMAEQFGAAPIALTIEDALGTYLAGATVTLTPSAPLFSADICYAGTVFSFQIPGGVIVRVTVTGYTGGVTCTGTIDSAVPLAMRLTPILWWSAAQPVYGPSAYSTLGQPSVSLTLTTVTTYAAGQPLTLNTYAGSIVFSQAMINGGAVYFYTSVGVIKATITGFANETQVTVVANRDIPAEIQGVATYRWNVNNGFGSNTWGPFGPNMPPGSVTIVISAFTTFAAGQTVQLTASANIFTAGMVAGGQIVAFHDTLGNVVQCQVTALLAANQVTAKAISAIPSAIQNVATAYWSMAQLAPASGGLSAQFWYPMPTAQVEVPTQVLAPAIGAIGYAQVNDLMTFTHQSFAPFQLLHYSNTRWQIRPYTPGISINSPINLFHSGNYGGALGVVLAYVVTAISQDNGEESFPSTPLVRIDLVPTSSRPITISWQAIVGASGYKIYQSQSNGVFGLIGQVTGGNGTFFIDTGFIPDIASQPPVMLNLFATQSDYPAVCGAFQQRLGLANTPNQPQTVVFTEEGRLNSMTVHTPLRDSDAIQETIAGTEVQPIQALVDLQKLVIHTSNAEYVVAGNVNGGISPVTGSFNVLRQSSNGSSAVRPIAIGITDLFVQARGTMLRDLKYDIRSYCYATTDLTEFSPDLFIGRTVVRMAWQQTKNSLVWIVMSDGALLSLTYIPGESITAWATHDTGGDQVVDVWTVQEGTEDAVYVGIVRTVGGVATTMIERLAQREFTDTLWLTDACFADSYQVYDGRNAGATTMVATTSSDWTPNSTFTLTASAGIFSAADAPAGNPQGMGNAIVLRQVDAAGRDTARVYFGIAQYISPTQVLCVTNANVPAWAQVALTTWGKAVHAFSGMDHLNGRALAILADATVVASPLSPDAALSGTPVVPAAGAWVLPGAMAGADPIARNAMVVCAGLPVMAEITTLPIENQKGESILGNPKTIKQMTATLYRARGFWYGQIPESNQALKLNAWKQRNFEALGSPNALFSGSQRVDGFTATWGTRGIATGQTVIQQPDPLPLGIGALTVLAEVGG